MQGLASDVSQLWVVSTSDGRRRLLTKGDAVNPAWSPEGSRIAYWGVIGTGKPAAIRTIPAAGPEDKGILALTDDLGAIQPAWSADGRLLYLSSSRGGTRNIWRVPIDSKTGRGLGPPEPVSVPSANAFRPSLSRRGMRLAFESAATSTQIRRIPFDSRSGLTAGPGEEVWSSSRELEYAHLSPDGAWLATSQKSPNEDLLLLKLDGSMVRQLTNDRAIDRWPRYSPDGTRVAFFSNRSGRAQIWEIHTDGSGLRHLPLDGHDLCYPVYSPDGARLVADRREGIDLALRSETLGLGVGPGTQSLLERASGGWGQLLVARRPAGSPET